MQGLRTVSSDEKPSNWLPRCSVLFASVIDDVAAYNGQEGFGL